MLEPASILSYYPKYSILDSIIQKGYKKINLFIDLKNCLQSIYMNHVILHLLESTEQNSRIDTSVVSSLISFLAFHKVYCLKRNIDINYYIFYDLGRSFWHETIMPSYKKSRKSDDLYGLDREKIDFYFKILQKNYMLIDCLLNKVPNVYAICLEHFETDFIPYYLLLNRLVDMSDDACHIIYSNDKDLLQILNLSKNSFQFLRKKREMCVVEQNQSLNYYLKTNSNYPDSYFSIALSILGDTSDDIPGIKDVGPKRLDKILDRIIELGGGVESIIDKAYNDEYLFQKVPGIQNKYIERIIENEEVIRRNLKLIDFGILSRVIDTYPKLEYRKKSEKIHNYINNKNIVNFDVLQKAIDLSYLYFEDNTLEILYTNSTS